MLSTSHSMIQTLLSHVLDALFHTYELSVYISLHLLLKCLMLLLAPLPRDKITSCCCHVHHVSLCHQSCASILQMEVPDGRPPVIKKYLFPLFSPKNNIKYSSSVRVLPVVSSPMVHAVLHYPTHLLTPCHKSNIACINTNNQPCIIVFL